LWAGFLTERLAVLGWVKYFHENMQLKYGFMSTGRPATTSRPSRRPQRRRVDLLVQGTAILGGVEVMSAESP